MKRNHDTEKHHPLPKEFQRKALGRIWDDTMVELDKDFHKKITRQTRFEGIPPAYTVGEIDLYRLRKPFENENSEEDCYDYEEKDNDL